MAVLLSGAAAFPAGANPGRTPGPATVGAVYSADFLVKRTALTPALVYPLGKQDYRTVVRMLDRAVMLATGAETISASWAAVLSPGDKVAILLDAQVPPASLGLLDALIDRLIRVGVRPSNIIVWAEDERSLFAAGLLVRSDPDGVRTMGADSEGYRGGVSRIVLEQCTVLINLARLRYDARLGMWGTTANQIASLPLPQRLELLANPLRIGSAAAKPTIRVKAKLHILDALQPNFEVGGQSVPPYWNCGKVLVSTDCVAVDMVGRQILEDRLAEMRGYPAPLTPEPAYLAAACDEYFVGQADPAQITVLQHTMAGE